MPNQIDVVGAVFIRRGSVFAARRGPDKAIPGAWEFPGGKIELGESPRDALVRELREELLIDARVDAHLTTTAHAYDFGVVSLSTYLCELVSGDPVLTEHSEARWVAVEDLPSLDWAPADIPAVELLVERGQRGEL
ncbi:(deoxy)nucleoside triphosphate pyrophosphohydrolase [Corynebacterium sanguinis]|uniref:8-oxo-dGTP diphosphatase n=1 Tax=Corynebacterium lipophiloflavum (strain ATCC 700352 / DSM 44291 / CCUG 37336 / JCM 10383 / DMMZ 1944) TaxID=525263 RepID=C0XQJ3_CORLD|nr:MULTISPECIES: (deoxy)nucleoside triphosphate pyrophosphohydrolase [Corynebacterium]EEI17407.1 mutator mutT protein [Corynebacterium lipophiloflavum DSM 44291]MCT1584374.1 (deoxy)nucleoside triphosphate pyrophosphohydrolase [Corynebacterium sanguinis]MCT1614741.1 (deoxy)nucleoside triphosphate pyrophosphohydrolase [Corynebacterium sanguinis]MCT1883376.1 (deoxy)nucleoside triphosphate pyrophosphohydrolase [Corynebacterium sanguinis]MCT2022360.1 (deoxy)nucleoside triphosphate pyrophosphohydrol